MKYYLYFAKSQRDKCTRYCSVLIRVSFNYSLKVFKLVISYQEQKNFIIIDHYILQFFYKFQIEVNVRFMYKTCYLKLIISSYEIFFNY